MNSPISPISPISPTTSITPISPAPIILPAVPKSFRTPALRRIGLWVRSAAARGSAGPLSPSPLSPRAETMVIGSTSNDVAPKKTIDVEAANSGNGVMITAEPVFAPVTGDSVPIHDDTTKQSNEDKKLAEAVLPSFLKQSKAQLHTKFMDLEWQARQRILEGLRAAEEQENGSTTSASPWIRLKGDEVMLRNRYMNVDPYASSRIHLKVPAGENDYINASPIVLHTTSGREKRYIATQGPKDITVPHFWRMILDAPSSPTVIVMLTQTIESNREKCYAYFPSPSPSSPDSPAELSISDPFFIGTVTLLSHRTDAQSKSEIRELLIRTEDGHEKRVWHLLYSAWPDFLVPEGSDRDALLALVKLSRHLAGEDDNGVQGERVVHCSAGVGRSGTFIALDWLMEELDMGALDDATQVRKKKADKQSSEEEEEEDSEADEEDSDPIMDLVDKLRQQRMMMVQGEMQFGYLYEVVAELWLQRWKARNVAS